MSKPKSQSSFLKQLLVFLFLIAAFLVIERQVNNFLGKQALEKTDLKHYRLEEALVLAKTSGKPIFADFAAIWCSACRKLDQTVFIDQHVKQILTENFHFVRLEYEDEQDKNWFNAYKVSRFPTLLLISANGDIIKNIPYPHSPKELIDMLKIK